MSFMGKGVTKSTVLCLLHLSHEMMAQAKDTVSALVVLILSCVRDMQRYILLATDYKNYVSGDLI